MKIRWPQLIIALVLLLAAGPVTAQQDVDIALDTFGVQSFYRPGDFVGIRLTLISNLDTPVSTQAVWDVPEALGDIAEHTRVPVALTPGVPIDIWMYAKLLPDVTNGTVWTVRVYEDLDGDRGAELGAARISPGTARTAGQLIEPTQGMIGLVGGARTAGLTDYNIMSPNSRGQPVTGHELTAVIAGIAPIDLPDQWEGLDCFEAIVWTDAQPGALSTAAGNALRDWIFRGGHLVIILSPSTNDWNIGSIANTPLHDLLPSRLPRAESMTLGELIPVLSKRDWTKEASLPEQAASREVTVRVFDESDLNNAWQPLIVLPEPSREIVAAQRLYGFGRMTLIGIELSSGQFNATALRIADGGGDVLEADVLWNRILGRRTDTLQRHQFANLENERRLDDQNRSPHDLGKGQLIVEQIRLSGQAAAGLSLAVVLFIAYWVLAGPVGFGLLKSAKKTRHAWVAFVATGALFTLLAWGGVQLFALKNVQVRHLTFVDYIARNPDDPRFNEPQYARATSWFTVFLPGYGDRELSIDTEPGLRNILAPFSAPGVDQTRFRNVDRYAVNLREPWHYEVPVRATSKEMYVRWLGAPPEEWQGMFTVKEPIRVTSDGRFESGVISHDLPTPLTGVHVILIQPRLSQQRRYVDEKGRGVDPVLPPSVRGSMPFVGSSWKYGALAPGDDLDLAARLVERPSLHQDLQRLSRSAANANDLIYGRGLTPQSIRTYMEVLGFFHMIEPPDYIKLPNSFRSDSQTDFSRWVGRELDISMWMTRPCLIITGYLEGSELPVPFRVDGSATQSDGLTIVRWMYPLTVTPDDLAEEVSVQ